MPRNRSRTCSQCSTRCIEQGCASSPAPTRSCRGAGLHRELELYVRAGFTPMEAIQAATLEPAKALGAGRATRTRSGGRRSART